MPLTNVLKLQLFSPEDARHVRGQRRCPERVAQLGRVNTRFCFISFISDRDGEILVSLHPFFSLGESYAVVKCGCISPVFYTSVSVLTGMCYAVPKTSGRLRYEANAILGQHFDDSGFVWLWFIWQQLLLWCLGAGICSARCVIIAGAIIALCMQRCLFCRRYLGMMFSPTKRRTARTAAVTCVRTEMFDSAGFFRYAGHITV